jgi:hypothetical protein
MAGSRRAAGRVRNVPAVSSVEAVRRIVAGWRVRGERIAFVPTMGFLHEGTCRWCAAPGAWPTA